jgi:REP element-mobilizing transposase RayT
MARPPRILLPHTVVMLTSRVQQGLPFVSAPLMDLIVWSALGVAQSLYPLKIMAFVVMGNHIHLIVLVEDPTTVESFMERFKCETAHAINRLLGRRQVTVWCEGYDSPVILTIDDLVEKLAYVYANPVRAHRSASIGEYQGVSSWGMFTSGQLVREVTRVRRTFLVPIATGKVSTATRLEEAALVENQATEALPFTLSPHAWTTAFENQSTPERLKERVLQRVQEIEAQMATVRERERISLPSEFEVTSQPIDTPYSPKKFGKRVWCICGDIPMRIAFISFIKSLREKARKVRLEWLQGNWREPFPIGLFPPTQPMLANVLPAYFRRSLASI